MSCTGLPIAQPEQCIGNEERFDDPMIVIIDVQDVPDIYDENEENARQNRKRRHCMNIKWINGVAKVTEMHINSCSQ